MSISEKLTTIAENQERVYEKGYDDALIDSLISSKSTNWSYAFIAGSRKELLDGLPYDATKCATNMRSAFQNSNVTVNGSSITGSIQADKDFILSSIPNLNFENVEIADNMFYATYVKAASPIYPNYNTIPKLSISLPKAKNLTYIFRNNTRPLSIDIDSPNGTVESLWGAFERCDNLETVGLFNTSKCTDFKYMFSYCKKLKSVPAFDMSSATQANAMFDTCQALTYLPALDTSKVQNMYRFVYYCIALKTMELLDLSSATNHDSLLYYCPALCDINEIRGNFVVDLNMQHNSSLSLATLKRIVSALKDYSGTTTTKTLTLHSSAKSRLDADGATSPNGNTWAEYVVDKGWTLK